MKRGLLLLPLLALLCCRSCGSEDALDPRPGRECRDEDERRRQRAHGASTMEMKMNGRTIEFGGERQVRLRRPPWRDHDGHVSVPARRLRRRQVRGADDRHRRCTCACRPRSARRRSARSSGSASTSSKALGSVGMGSFDPTNMQQDPTKMLELLRASSTSVTKTGSANIRGVPTTRYTAKLDLQKSLEAGSDQLEAHRGAARQDAQDAQQLEDADRPRSDSGRGLRRRRRAAAPA